MVKISRIDDFQNNERPVEQGPINPFRTTQRPSGIFQRPQVDEFGNPLEDIRSVDTTRFELGEGIDANEVGFISLTAYRHVVESCDS